MKFFFIGLYCLLTVNLFAQQLTKDQLIEDLTLLTQSIKKINPALTAYTPNFEAEAAKIIQSITKGGSLVEAFALYNKLGALSNEGHFTVDAAKVFKGILDNTVKYMPLDVKIIEDRIYVWRTFTTETKLRQGDEIRSINGQTSSQIVEQLYLHIPSDGDIKTYKTHKASNGFAWMYYLFIEQTEAFELVYFSAEEETEKTIVINALTRETQATNLRKQMVSKAKAEKVDSVNDFYEFKIKDKHAYLQLKSFDFRLVNKYKLKADELYEQLFQQIKTKGIKHLIIDLRNNTGGRTEFAAEMIPFILKNEKGDFLKKSISWKGKKKKYKFPKRHKMAFDGKIYVLTNGLTFSAAGTLTRYLKEYGAAQVIGEETGARYEGYAAGSSEELTLPHSSIKIYIPRYHTYYPAAKNQKSENRGALPDFPITKTILDFKMNKDRVLEKALQLIYE